MKKIALILILLIASLMTFAQQLNSDGKKLIKSITCIKNNEKILKYLFTYDNEGRLVKFCLCNGDGKQRIYYMEFKNNTLSRFDYQDGKLINGNRYSYIINEERNILERSFKSYPENYVKGNIDEWFNVINYYEYGYPYRDDIRQIVKENMRNIEYHKKNGKLVKVEETLDRHEWTYSIKNGNSYQGDTRGTEETTLYNDTNINFIYIFSSGRDIEKATEWCNVHLEYLPRSLYGRNYRYYFTKTIPHNLYKIEHYCDEKVYRTYLIEYEY